MKLFDFGNTKYKWVDVNDTSKIYAAGYDKVNPIESIVSVFNANDIGGDVYAISVRPNEFNNAVIHEYNRFNRKIHFLKYQPRLLRVNYADTQTFGIDRFAALLGAKAQGLYPSIIVDAGTAVTIDVLSPDQQHLGGCILPGKRLMLEAMTNKSPALKYVNEQDNLPFNFLGSSTQECMISGVARSIAGAVFSAQVSLGQDYSIYVTGGDAQWVLNSLGAFNAVGHSQPSLIFEGIKQMIRGE